MPRLINEDRLKHAVYEYVDKYGNIEMSIVDFNIMLERNRVDADPGKHGHWIFNPKDAIDMMFTLPKCSECGAESPNGGNYCPNCGAKMDGERREDDA